MGPDSLNRRAFIRGAAALGTAACMTGQASAMSRNGGGKNIALQLYTLRELTSGDFTGALEQVSAMGYPAVEFAGYGGMDAPSLKSLLERLDLGPGGSHVGYSQLSSGLDDVISFNRAIGNTFVTCPSMPGEFRERGAAGFMEFGELLNPIGEKCRAAGITLSYHNHAFEFERENGRPLLDHLFDAADPSFVKAQVDVFWVRKGGDDPAAFIARHRDRIASLHMKDMTGDSDATFAPVGAGVMDMRGIVRAGLDAGVEWYIVEQDRTKRPPLEAVKISLDNLKNLLGV